MPIHAKRSILVDDSRTFSAEDLTEVWAWLDSFDAQPLRPRDGEEHARPPLTFHLGKRVFGEKTYNIVRSSDGRELLGSVIAALGKTEVKNSRHWNLERVHSFIGRV